METIPTGLRELSPDNEELPLSVHTVVSDDDLLNEILVRLPVLSLVLFKSVSRRWLSLIKDAAFIKRRSRIPKIDPPSGLFIHRGMKRYGFVPFDIRIPSHDEKMFKTVPRSGTTLLQSCNGLFLCSVMPGYRFCVYNPTINMFKVLPEPLNYEPKLYNFTRMEFDPTISPHYKVVHAKKIDHDYRFRIQTYSSETGIWSIVCSCSDPYHALQYSGIYWNDAIHGINCDIDWYSHYIKSVYIERWSHNKLDFVNKNVVLTDIQLPVTMDNSYCKLFESRGCLLLIGKDKTHSDQLNVYEMRNGHPSWTFKYSVNHSRISLYSVLCIAMGEREEDSFMVIEQNGQVGLYKFVTKTFCELLEQNEQRRYSSEDSFLFIPSFASV